MAFDSRRWTGRYAPGEAPLPNDLPRPYRRRWVRWMLLAVILAVLALSIAQLWVPAEPNDILPLGWMLALPAIGAATGLSPFARGLLLQEKAGYDEFERQALTRAAAGAYMLLLGLMVVAPAYCAWATVSGWPVPHRTVDWTAWVTGVLVVGTNLPATLAEFAIPFPPVEEEPA